MGLRLSCEDVNLHMEDMPLTDIFQFLRRHILLVGIFVLGLIIFIGGLIWLFPTHQEEEITFEQPTGQAAAVSPTSSQITVDIAGAVLKPGVYGLDPDTRLKDAITQAGGLRPDADADIIAKQINLAQKLSDSMKIYIPFKGEVFAATGGTGFAGASTTNLVNINTASLSDLDRLPKIGEVTAQKIISGRPYGSIEDLTVKKVISSSVFAAIEKMITSQ